MLGPTQTAPSKSLLHWSRGSRGFSRAIEPALRMCTVKQRVAWNASFMHGRQGDSQNPSQGLGACRFFLTLARTPWLDMKHVVFGQVSTHPALPRCSEPCGCELCRLTAMGSASKHVALMQVVEGYEVVKAAEACGELSGTNATPLMWPPSSTLWQERRCGACAAGGMHDHTVGGDSPLLEGYLDHLMRRAVTASEGALHADSIPCAVDPGSRSGDTSHDVMIADCGVLSKSAVRSGATAAMQPCREPQRPARQHTVARQHLCRTSLLHGQRLQQR